MVLCYAVLISLLQQSQVIGMEGDMASEMDEADFVDMLNRVLHIVGLRAKVSRFDECAQVAEPFPVHLLLPSSLTSLS